MTSILRFAVIGNPVNHSLSPLIHEHFARQFFLNLQYEKLRGQEAFLESQIQTFFQEGGKGMNVTIPFKQQAFELVEVPSPRSLRSKTVNTLWIEEGRLYGDNTDGIGLIHDLQHYLIPQQKSVLLIGAGGAARAILPSLLDVNAKVTVVNRTFEKVLALKEDFPEIHYMEFGRIEGQFDIIINATAASLMQENVFLPEIVMQTSALCYDLSYLAQGLTPFTLYAATLGCSVTDGLGMLVEQAAEAFFIWNKLEPNKEEIKQILRKNQLHFKKS